MARNWEFSSIFNDRAKIKEVIDPNGRNTNYLYDDFLRLKKTTEPGGDQTEFEYDETGFNIKSIIKGNIKTFLNHDQNGNLIEYIHNEGLKSDTIKATWFETDNSLKSLNFNGREAKVEKGPNGEIRIITVGEVIYVFTLNEMNQITSRTEPNGRVTEFKYDQNGIVSEIIVNGETITTIKPQANQILEISGGPEVYILERDYQNSKLQIGTIGGQFVEYIFDETTNTIHTNFVGIPLAIERDHKGLPTSIKYGTGTLYEMEYDGHKLKSIKGPTGIITTFTYDENGNVSERIENAR